jgi:hypothetical protein
MTQPNAWQRWFESRSGAPGIVHFKPADVSCVGERGIDCGALSSFDVKGNIARGSIPGPDRILSQRVVGAGYRRQNFILDINQFGCIPRLREGFCNNKNKHGPQQCPPLFAANAVMMPSIALCFSLLLLAVRRAAMRSVAGHWYSWFKPHRNCLPRQECRSISLA